MKYDDKITRHVRKYMGDHDLDIQDPKTMEAVFLIICLKFDLDDMVDVGMFIAEFMSDFRKLAKMSVLDFEERAVYIKKDNDDDASQT